MATTKVSELAELTSTDGAEQLLVNDGGTSKRLLISNLPVGSLGANTVDSDQYVDGSIDEVHIADDAVTADKLANSINTAIAANTAKTGITSGQASAITANTAKVTNATHTGDVTGATALTIADDAVTAAKLANSINTDIATGVTAGTVAAAALPKSGGTMTGSFTLNDNNKAQYGTGDDLQIYHDGSNSYIADAGTGVLNITADNQLILGKYNTSEKMAAFNTDGSAELYHDNVKKIETTAAGVTVTGVVAATTLTGDGSGLTGLGGGFSSGTSMVFYQASAPTGWTKSTSNDNKALRVVSGSGGGTGGSWALSSGDTSSSDGAHTHSTPAHSHSHSLSAGAHTLSTSEMPSHTHTEEGYAHSKYNYPPSSGDVISWGVGFSSQNTGSAGSGSSHSHSLSGSISSGGSGTSGSSGAHTHTIGAPQYIDVIVCSKD